MFNQARPLPYTAWSEVRRTKVYTLEKDRMLVHSCPTVGVGVMQSPIEHERAAMEHFDRVQFRNRMVMRGYSGMLIQVNECIRQKGLEQEVWRGRYVCERERVPDIHCTNQG